MPTWKGGLTELRIEKVARLLYVDVEEGVVRELVLSTPAADVKGAETIDVALLGTRVPVASVPEQKLSTNLISVV
jgi:hypothetical protein